MTDDRWASQTWRPYARDNPYYAVCNEDMYRRDRMDASAREAFFASGEAHVSSILTWIDQHVLAGFHPRRVLDFGSGVGRVLIPLARRAEEATGLDVATEMNAEAARNCAEQGITNARFVLSDDELAGLHTQFDLIHSFIVFQHIPPVRGEAIFSALVDRLAPGGVGAIHFTYARAAASWRKLANRLRRNPLFPNAIVNLAQGRPLREPLIPMYEYNLDRLFEILRRHGCEQVGAILTDHGGHHGAILVFRAGQ